jgi:hypothetical protein
MKKIVYLLSFSIIIVSCTSTQFTLSKFKGSKNNNANSLRFLDKENTLKLEEIRNSQRNYSNENNYIESQSQNSISASSSFDLLSTPINSKIEFVTPPNRTTYLKDRLKNTEDCAEIIKKDGKIIEGKIIEVGVTEIKYKKCENNDGPVYSILKSDVFMIKYKNGENDVFNQNNSNSIKNVNNMSNSEPFSIVSIVSGSLALFFGLLISISAGLIFGVLGMIFGLISLNQLKNNTNKYTKNSVNLAKVGLITSIIITSISSLLLFYIYLV